MKLMRKSGSLLVFFHFDYLFKIRVDHTYDKVVLLRPKKTDMFIGEILSIGVAISWTATALFAEVASKRIGSLPLNVTRMVISLVLFAITLWLAIGVPYPRFADASTLGWLILSGVVGYVIGDYCLFQGYIFIGSRFGQLFMSLSAPSAAITGRLLLGEQMRPLAIVGMCVTLTGIALSILSKEDGKSGRESASIRLKLPFKGILYACGAGVCQGIGLVLSKCGMEAYHAAVSSQGLTGQSIPTGALLPIPLDLSMPFAGTMIRACVGLIGFLLMLMLFSKNGVQQLRRAFHDRKSMWCAFASTFLGPFFGVSLSLLAVQHTTTGVAQTLFALTPILIIAPAAWLFGQRVTAREVIGATISVAGACMFFL